MDGRSSNLLRARAVRKEKETATHKNRSTSINNGKGSAGTARVLAAVFAAALLLASGCKPPDGGSDKRAPNVPPRSGSISGTVIPPARTVADSDNLEPLNPRVSNDTGATAQQIENLVTVIGYVSSADPWDYFEAPLTARETVELRAGDTAELNLLLYDGATLLDSRSGPGSVKTVASGSTAGLYRIAVQHAAGQGSLYKLSVGTAGASAAMASLSSASHAQGREFRVGQAVVKLKDRVIKSAAREHPGMNIREAARQRAGELASRHGARLEKGGARGLFALGFDTGHAKPRGRAASKEARKKTLEKIAELARDPEVAYAEPNYIWHATAVPDDTFFANQWGLPLIHAPEAWDGETGDPAAVIAVIDTGILENHPDLTANLLMDGVDVVGYDMITAISNSGDGDERDPDPHDEGDAPPSSSFHGSHVAGIAAAVTDNGRGIAGTAWNVSIMPVRVIGREGGDIYDVADGILFAAGLYEGATPKVGGVTVTADVINLSLGGETDSQSVEDAVSQARAMGGAIIVASTGNDAVSTPFFPASYQGVVGVSAVDIRGERAYYSNFGSYVDVAAPGGDYLRDVDNDGLADGILSTVGDDSAGLSYVYIVYEGTSMAAPHVSGVAALMKSAYPLLSPSDFDDLLSGSSAALGNITHYPAGYWEEKLGYGIIRADKAVAAAQYLSGNTAAYESRIELLPSALNFDFNKNSLKSWIANRGTKPLSGVTVASSAPGWLTCTLNGTTSITFEVDRGDPGLSTPGSYNAEVVVKNLDGDTDTAHINVLVGSTLPSDPGLVHVFLLNPSGFILDYDTTSAWQGYSYRFKDVGVGEYYVAAGTDLDDDDVINALGFFNDDGELFGFHPGEKAAIVTVASGDSVAGIDLRLSFQGLPIK